MMKVFVVFTMLVLFSAVVAAQAPASTPPPQPRPQPPPTSTPPPNNNDAVPTQRPGQRGMDLRRLDPFSLNNVSDSDMLSYRVKYVHEVVAPLYRKPSNKELASLQPSEAVLQQYAAFLKRADTGIFRLAPDSDCVNNENVVSVSDECLKYAIPGAGNSYSFRNESHRMKHLADITVQEKKLRMTGIFMHGMMAEIGDVAIADVAANSPAVKFLASFQPSAKIDDMVEKDRKIRLGIDAEGHRFAKEVEAKPDTTYVLRAVAYRGRLTRSHRGVRYNELSFDKRRDIIVAFRIVEMDEQGGMTIVWSKLSEKESPKIKVSKKNGIAAANDDDGVEDK